jgi:hypothetical protein
MFTLVGQALSLYEKYISLSKNLIPKTNKDGFFYSNANFIAFEHCIMMHV